MKQLFAVTAIAVALVGLSGCQPVASPLGGWVYNETKFGDTATTGTAASKEGKACASTILGMVATGDASLRAAKAAGGITEVSEVDHSAKNLLGIFAEFCTIVRGR